MRKHKSDKGILFLSIALMLVGLIVIYTVGPSRANYLNAAYGYEVVGQHEYFIHQLISVVAAVAVLIIAAKFPYDKTQKMAKAILLLGFLACALLAILAAAGSGLANCTNGACRWISITSSLSIQPAEILKLGLVLYLSGLMTERKQEGNLNKAEFWLPFLIVLGLAMLFVVVLQKDLGSGISIGAIALAMLFASGVDWRQFAVLIIAVVLLGVGSVVLSPHRMERIMTYAGGGDDYHITNALMALGSGGLTGVGAGKSVEATGYLPESINDSVFAVMGETFGFIGLMVVLGCFLALAMRLLGLAKLADTENHSLVAVGMFAWITIQVAINVMAMTGMIPLTGITLPLLSYGGTSMLFIAAGLGICLQLSCYTRREEKHESASGRRGIRGTHHASRRGRA